MRTANKILVGLAGLVAGGISYAMWLREQETIPIVSNTQSANQNGNLGSDSISEETQTQARENILQPAITPEQLKKKYAAYEVWGFVHSNQRPLQNVTVEASLARIIANRSELWHTTTDSKGRFHLRVPKHTLYDIEASFATSYGSERRREITVGAQQEGEQGVVDIEFSDTPDVTIHVEGNELIKRACLQKANNKNLEARIEGTTARFEDVDPNQLYTLHVLTEGRSAISDAIPVFDEDVCRTYHAPEKKFREIRVVDKDNGQRISQAQIELTLAKTEQGLYKETLVTDAEGVWRGWLGNHEFSARTTAEEYIRDKKEKITLDDQTTIRLRKGAVVKGQVVDEQEKPVEHAEVYFLDPLDMSPREDLKPQKTNSEGMFTVAGINPNKEPPFDTRLQELYIPVAVKEGYMQAMLEARDAQEKNIRLHISRPRETLEGKISSPAGSPVQSLVEVELLSLQGSQQDVSNTPFWMQQKLETDKEGRFAVSQLPAGTYLLKIQPNKNDQGLMETRYTARIPAEPINITLNQGVRLEGRVIGEATGLGLADVNITLTDRQTRAETHYRTDQQGCFKGFVAPGQGSFYAFRRNPERKNSIEERQGSYQIDEQEKHLQIIFDKKTYLTVIAQDAATQQPIQQYTASFQEKRPEGNYANARNGFDKQGKLELPISYPMQLWVNAPGYQRSEVMEVQKSGENTTLYVDMKKK